MFVTLINSLLKFGTLVVNILLIVFLVFLLFFLFFNKKKYLLIKKFFRRHGLKIIFLFSFLALLGSLFYSEILKYVPCTLCWYQRVFMYSLVLMSGFMFYSKKTYLDLITLFAGFGAFFSLIHYINQVIVPSILSCSGDGVDCSVVTFTSYGYITIPIMALSVFVIILLVASLMKK